MKIPWGFLSKIWIHDIVMHWTQSVGVWLSSLGECHCRAGRSKKYATVSVRTVFSIWAELGGTSNTQKRSKKQKYYDTEFGTMQLETIHHMRTTHCGFKIWKVLYRDRLCTCWGFREKPRCTIFCVSKWDHNGLNRLCEITKLLTKSSGRKWMVSILCPTW